MPSWATVVCDGLLGAGVLDADDLDGLTASQMTHLARLFLTSISTGQIFDAMAAVESARQWTPDRQQNERRRRA